jgi:hypothetical protein
MKPFFLQTATYSWQYARMKTFMAPKRDLQAYINPWSRRSQRQLPILAKITGEKNKLLAYDCTGQSLTTNIYQYI